MIWTSLINLQPSFYRWNLAYFCLAKCPIMESTLISPNFNLSMAWWSGGWWMKEEYKGNESSKNKEWNLPLNQPSPLKWIKFYLNFVFTNNRAPFWIRIRSRKFQAFLQIKMSWQKSEFWSPWNCPHLPKYQTLDHVSLLPNKIVQI